MPDEDESHLADRAPSSVLRPRLAAAEVNDVPALDDLGLRRAKDAAFAWQEHRARAELHEMVWLTENATSSEWVGEVHGLFGIVGELVLVAIEAEAEKQLLRDALGSEQSLPMQAGFWRALRFFAEGQGNDLVVAGHGIANITLRTLALHADFDASRLPKIEIDQAAFKPRADHRRAWASLNHKTSTGLVSVASALGLPELVVLCKALLDLTAEGMPWRELNDLRGEQYHRWRGESHGVAG